MCHKLTFWKNTNWFKLDNMPVRGFKIELIRYEMLRTEC